MAEEQKAAAAFPSSAHNRASDSRRRGSTDDSSHFFPRKRPAIEPRGGHSHLLNNPPRPELPRRFTTTTTIQFLKTSIHLTLTDSGSVAEDWVRQQAGNFIVGFDIEWQPSFKKGVENPTALLQLCVENQCLIIQMLYVDFIPQALVGFLKDPRLSLVGVGIEKDAAKLRRDHGLECGGEVEVGPLAAEKMRREELEKVGLKGLAMAVLGFEVKKPKKVTMSNWGARHLQPVQMEYACIDAFVSFAIGKKLLIDMETDTDSDSEF